MNMRRLDDPEIRAALETLPGWTLREGKLCREFQFPDFREAFQFMTRVAEIAEEMNHHPDWRNSYNRVDIELITHDLDALSPLDVELARRITGNFQE